MFYDECETSILRLLKEDKNDMELYCACLTGASFVSDIEDMLKNAGFTNIVIKAKDESKLYIKNWTPGSNLEDYVVSATIEACKRIKQ